MPIPCLPLRSGRFRGLFCVLTVGAALTGCASLPSSGPTGVEIRRAAVAKPGQYPFTLVEVENAATVPPAPSSPASTLASMPPQPTDLLGPGDVLNISVYEAGVSLFGTALKTVAAGSGSIVDTSSSAERLPPVRVDDYGSVRVPFVGRVRAAGHTVAELQSIIQSGLRGMFCAFGSAT